MTDKASKPDDPTKVDSHVAKDIEKATEHVRIIERTASGKSVPSTIDEFEGLREKPRWRTKIANGNAETREYEHLHGKQLWFAFFAWFTMDFMRAFGMLLHGPSTPVIASLFGAEHKLGFISAASHLTTVGGVLLYGQLMVNYNAKWVLLGSVICTIVGSLVTGLAPIDSVNTFILGKAIDGFGAAGAGVCLHGVLALLIDLEERPRLFGLLATNHAVCGAVAPILGGVLVDAGYWRWTYLLSVPAQAVVLGLIYFTCPSLPAFPLEEKHEERLARQLPSISKKSLTVRRAMVVDYIGYLLVTASLLCMILGIQFGGGEKEGKAKASSDDKAVHGSSSGALTARDSESTPGSTSWGTPRVVGLLVGFVLLFGSFIAWEIWGAIWPILAPKTAFKNRTIAGSAALGFFGAIGTSFLMLFIPVLFEALRGVSVTETTIIMLPSMLAHTLAGVLLGFIMTFTGRYWHWGVFGPCLTFTASVLLWKVKTTTSNASIIADLVLFNIGSAMIQPVANIAIQAATEPKDVVIALSTVHFVQGFGGLMAPVIGNSILNNSLRTMLADRGVPLDIAHQVERSIIFVQKLTGEMKDKVIAGYLGALHSVFAASLPFAILVFLCMFFVQDLSLKPQEPDSDNYADPAKAPRWKRLLHLTPGANAPNNMYRVVDRDSKPEHA